jgi:hypothetical protein
MTATAARELTTTYRLRRLARLLTPLARISQLFKTAPLVTVAEYLATKGLEPGVLRSVQTTFGKRVKALYIETTGREPKTIPGVVIAKGKARNIKTAAYPAHVAASLFAQIWDQHYAH